MREIKFRYWDRGEKKMIYLANPLILHLPDNYGQSDYMQFTELKDKNGKEIYEGDIVKTDLDVNYFIEYRRGSFWICDSDGGGIWVIETYHEIKDECRLEVIGNKFENPELLK